MAVSMADIKKLRDMTNAGMMDCKNALNESNGDIQKAIEIIRKKGQAIAAKRSDRKAAEGCVLAKSSNDFAAVVALKCETDFVAKNADFIALTQSILDAALANRPANLDALKALEVEGRTIENLITDRSGVTGEKMELSDYEFVSGATTTAYVHPGNKLATVVAFKEANAAYETIHGIAMQVAAMNPLALDADSISQEVKDRELSVAIDKTKEELVKKDVENALKKAGFNLYISENEEHLNEGIMKGNITAEQADEIRALKASVSEQSKANMQEAKVQNIAKGRLNKFFQENTLMEQAYIMDGKTPIKEILKSAGITASAFKRITLNEE